MSTTRTSRLVVATLLALFLTPTAALAHSADDATELTLYAAEREAVYLTRDGEVIDEEEFNERADEVGDRFFVVDELYADEDRTELVGRNHISCTFTEVSGDLPVGPPDAGEPEAIGDFSVTLTCSGVAELDDQGTLTWTGVVSFTDEDLTAELDPTEEPFIVVAITGGTFDLIGASGEVEIFDEEAPTVDETWTRYEVTLL